jgi:putative alpha-1,2-mannosidase
MKKALLFFTIVLVLSACKNDSRKQPADFVNPFIGTGGHGHTYPGAAVPFGMVQLSPDTRKDSWDGCSGYHYSDDVVF